MAERPSDLVQGTLDMLILKTLALEPMHSYGIAVRLEHTVCRFSAASPSRDNGGSRATKEWGRQMAAIARIPEAS